MRWKALSAAVAITAACSTIGCDGMPFASPGDKEALRNSCYIGVNTCKKRCRADDCVSACNAGLGDCIENIDEYPPKEWEPADAFHDGCTDACSDDECSNACYSGQNAIATDSGPRLRKYGVITFNDRGQRD